MFANDDDGAKENVRHTSICFLTYFSTRWWFSLGLLCFTLLFHSYSFIFFSK